MDQVKVFEIPGEIQQMVRAREEARKAKDWDLADRLRDEIASKGYSVEDTTGGPKLKRASGTNI